MSVLESTAQYALRVVVITALQLGILLGPALLFGLLIHGLSGHVRVGVSRLLGLRGYLALFGWLGTSVHEASHALFCLLFRHKVVEIRFFRPDPDSGTLGYVRHSYDRRSPYQVVGNFFISIAPILVGAALIYLTAWLLLGAGVVAPMSQLGFDAAASEPLQGLKAAGAGLLEQVRVLFERLFSSESLSRWELWVFLYLAFTIGSSMRLSRADLKGARSGFVALVLGLLLFNAVTGWLGDFGERVARSVTGACGLFYSVLILAVVLNALAVGALAILRIPSLVVKKLG